MQQIFAQDDDRHAGRADVLLRAGVDQPVFRNIQRAADKIRGRIANQRNVRRGNRFGRPFHALDGLVRGEVQIRRLRIQLQFVLGRDAVEVGRFGGRGEVDRAALLRFLDRGLRPVAGQDGIDRDAGRAQVHRDHAELQVRASLQEEHFVVGRNAVQGAQIGFGPVDDVFELGGAVAHFQDRHPRTGVVEQFLPRFLQHGLGQHGGPGRKVADSPCLLIGVYGHVTLSFRIVVRRLLAGKKELLRPKGREESLVVPPYLEDLPGCRKSAGRSRSFGRVSAPSAGITVAVPVQTTSERSGWPGRLGGALRSRGWIGLSPGDGPCPILWAPFGPARSSSMSLYMGL